MASLINHQLHREETVCLSVMRGGLIPTAYLLPRLKIPLELDYIHATRYSEGIQGGELKWLKYPTVDLKDRSVLIIDDILDTGLTLQIIITYCQQANPKQILTAVLTQKIKPQRPGLMQADFVGLYVPNVYVFGSGMDYQGNTLRHITGIYAVNSNIIINSKI